MASEAAKHPDGLTPAGPAGVTPEPAIAIAGWPAGWSVEDETRRVLGYWDSYGRPWWHQLESRGVERKTRRTGLRRGRDPEAADAAYHGTWDW